MIWIEVGSHTAIRIDVFGRFTWVKILIGNKREWSIISPPSFFYLCL